MSNVMYVCNSKYAQYFSNHLSSTSYHLHTSRLQRMLADRAYFLLDPPTWKVQGLPLLWLILDELGSEIDAVHLYRPHGQSGVGVLGVVGCGAWLTQTAVLRGGEGEGRDRGVGSGHGLINHLFHTVGKVICVGEHVKHDSV